MLDKPKLSELTTFPLYAGEHNATFFAIIKDPQSGEVMQRIEIYSVKAGKGVDMVLECLHR